MSTPTLCKSSLPNRVPEHRYALVADFLQSASDEPVFRAIAVGVRIPLDLELQVEAEYCNYFQQQVCAQKSPPISKRAIDMTFEGDNPHES